MTVKEVVLRFIDKYNQFGRRIFGPKVLLAYLFTLNMFIYFDRGVVSVGIEDLQT